MRLWSLHPQYLDRQGLTACWREALLAQAVIAGRTKGYTKHPQLERFYGTANPLAAIGCYLQYVQVEATSRGYNFAASRIELPGEVPQVPVTTGQIAFEREHLLRKLSLRSPQLYPSLEANIKPALHPLFIEVPGEVASWERV